jgi:hypothetical protein
MSFWTDVTDWLGGATENINWGNVLSLGASYALNQSGFANSSAPQTGYQGGIPRYTLERAEVANTYDPNRRPGSSGQRYFSDRVYTPEGEESVMPALQEQAQGLAALNAANPARQVRPPRPEASTGTQGSQPASMAPILSRAPARVIEDAPVPRPVEGLAGFKPQYAEGGITGLYGPRSPMADKTQQKNGYYLGGSTDGMADQVPAQIDGRQPAALSDGEFVIPADVVSHLGNGNSDAGAQQLHSMMDRVRKERTGTTQQGKQINPAAFMPK